MIDQKSKHCEPALDFRNVNALWSSILVETLRRLGVMTAVVCPGSRSSPLTVAFAKHPDLEAIPILDERSAAFFALGRGKMTGIPVALVCTSGTAGANFYPAIIEARESGIPLLVLSADRPPEMRHCHSGQTIDQQRLYGNYPTWQVELALPSAEMEGLRYLRQTLIHATARSRFPIPGAVHLNCPFRDPLAPIKQDSLQLTVSDFDGFFSHLKPPASPRLEQPLPWETWQSSHRGIIIAGVDQPLSPEQYARAIAQLSNCLGWVVLAEGLSPVRNYAHLVPNLISTYDFILRDRGVAESLIPEMVIQIGAFPTSKTLRQWFNQLSAQCWLFDDRGENLDPIHQKTIPLQTKITDISSFPLAPPVSSSYQKQWLFFEEEKRDQIDHTCHQTSELIEPKIAWLLSQTLPQNTPLFIANSLPVRDVEWFWAPNQRQIYPLFNRGANGIDGTLSTALGIAHSQKSTVCLTGDLALLHDTNGFLSHDKFQGHLTIILVNNNGGGIFEMLPIAQFPDVFEDYFATPQNIDFATLAKTYGLEYQLIKNWEQLRTLLNPLPQQGIRLLEIQTDRRQSKQWRENDYSIS
ncbi:2-succinyl-5-enolpyruvyl-6-hydroxy-3-cyclohexene-1-carboxylic-acid synthase [Halothece sp. PCC 7418]|uniref:2-succinyl-5-enolpyruvyl-6-hydroxy-3- cyclohexene-1-carboxylic-acid synthase n=1 Tax=Halothece sp. (strain PCC 7418) TaxID=65093 RepID=UPI0002DA8731|nr:2-succinyl-5-enolpyruvyl-6-hydroxy-3-cyclohexene-1-carboxylic-acid synthase [Halothece sp. PCC 7418]